MGELFDEHIERRGTGSVKWDDGPDDVLPMWVADMDFRPPREVTDAIARRNDHGIYGYEFPPDEYYDAFIDWMERRHSTWIERKWIVPVPTVISGINLALSECTRTGESVVIQPPVYYPFPELVRRNGRTVRFNPLIRNENGYTFDPADLRAVLKEDASALILCSPHNPVGRVWNESELSELLDLCAEHRCTIISDEIHQDLVLPGYEQLPLLRIRERLGGKAGECPIVVATAATKTFNLAGLGCAMLVIPDPVVRKGIKTSLRRFFFHFMPNTLSVAATTAG